MISSNLFRRYILTPFLDPQKKAQKIQTAWSQLSYESRKAEIKRAALLAWDGHLTSVKNMRFSYISITDIPRDHMEKLASIITETVWIANMIHADQLGSILASVKCTRLLLWGMELSEGETWALVTAMRDRVERVWLCLSYDTLDIEELTQYEGLGHCSSLRVGGNTRVRYGDRLRRWAADKGWTLTLDNDKELEMERE